MAELNCSSCEELFCRDGVDCYDMSEQTKNLYAQVDSLGMKMLRAAAKTEARGYMRWPRAQEILSFAQAAGFTKLGVAFCAGLHREADQFTRLLKRHFSVSSVCCKVCGVFKAEFGLEQINSQNTEEVMCSPLGQAELLNQAGTELNIVMGLCVGHDALFSMHANAPVTTLIAKDRVLAHNPAGALYSNYWCRKLNDRNDG